MKQEFEIMGIDAKAHLEKYPLSICEIRVEEDLMDDAKEIIANVVGEELFKRINFFPKR
jgi:hypothetical protein